MSSAAGLPDFDEPQLARAIERLTEEQVDQLPFGVVRLDLDHTVKVFSGPECRLSGWGDRPRLGRKFFTEIAPCMGTPRFLGLIEHALATGALDLEFTHIGDFSDRERELTVRVQSATDGGYWIFMRRED
jgi:photoactive yellow protein